MTRNTLTAALVAATLLAGCSGDEADSLPTEPPVRSSPATSTAATTPAPTTTTAAPTTTAPPTTVALTTVPTTSVPKTTAPLLSVPAGLTPDQQAVEDAVLDYERANRACRRDIQSCDVAEYTARMVDPLKSVVVDTVRQLKDDGITFGDVDSRGVVIEEIDIDGPIAVVRACVVDEVVRYSADGTVADPGGVSGFLAYQFFNDGERWFLGALETTESQSLDEGSLCA